jgi:hypothetical protein
VQHFKADSELSEKDAAALNEFSEIAFDKTAPRHLREYAVIDLMKGKVKKLSKLKKLFFLDALLKENQKDEAFTSFLTKSRTQVFSGKSKDKITQPKKSAKKKPLPNRLLRVFNSADDEFMAQTLAYLKRYSTKARPWGTKLPEADFLKIQKLIKLSDHGFYLHRNLISSHQIIPYTEDRDTRTRSLNLDDVTSWKAQNNPILQSFCTETEEIIEARQRYKVIGNRLNIEDRYLLKDLTFDIATTRGNPTLRYDFVGLTETDLGLKGSWIISILGMRPETIKPLLDFNWETLRTFLKKSKVESRGMSPKMLDTTVLIEASSDNDARKEIGFFLEELMVIILGAKITGFQINETSLTPAQQSKRLAQIKSLQKRTQWIIKNPRGPYINNCLVCGRGLSVSISVDRAIGPGCWEKLSREKEIKKIDLRPGYNPLRYEAIITKEELLDNLIATYSSRV